jgi:hypothetical protein
MWHPPSKEEISAVQRERGERGGRVNQFPLWEKYAWMLSGMTDSHLKILADAWNF